MGRHTGIKCLPPRQEVVHAFSDHSKLGRFFGLRDSVSLREGLERMAAWAWRVGPRQSKEFSQIEIKRDLPASWSGNVQSVDR
jgi:UDP-glucose 4-epimerase